MQNGLVEPSPFTTILVSANSGVYPLGLEFSDFSEEDFLTRFVFKHGECGGSLALRFAEPQPKDRYVAMQCEQCGSGIKMYQNVFFGELARLAYHRTRWVNGAYRFIRKCSPSPADESPWWIGVSVRCEDGGCGKESVLIDNDRIEPFIDNRRLGAVQCHECDGLITVRLPEPQPL